MSMQVIPPITITCTNSCNDCATAVTCCTRKHQRLVLVGNQLQPETLGHKWLRQIQNVFSREAADRTRDENINVRAQFADYLRREYNASDALIEEVMSPQGAALTVQEMHRYMEEADRVRSNVPSSALVVPKRTKNF